MSTRLSKLFLLQVANAGADILAWSFFPLYAFKNGLEYYHIIIAYFLIYAFGAFIIALSSIYGRRGNMGTGLLLKGLSVILLVIPINEYVFYLACIINGLSLRFFWVPYNAYFMEAVSGDKRAESSGKLFFMLAASGAALPLAGGWIITVTDYSVLFVISFFGFLAGALYATLKIKPEPFVAKLNLQDIRRLGFLLFEGVWQGAFWISVPLATIFFLKREMDFGIFMAFLGAMGGFSSVVVGRWSDAKGERRRPLAVSAFIAFIFSVSAAFSMKQLVFWAIFIGSVYFFIYIMYSFTFTYAREACGDSYVGMATRELLLNLGRVSGALLLLGFLLITKDLLPGLLIGAFSLLVIAMIVFMAKHPSLLNSQIDKHLKS